MKDSVVERVRGANSKLRALISRMRESLGGRGNFCVVDVREMAEPVGMMQSIIAEADELRTIHPDLNGELEAYAGNLGEMQVALEQMRFMILARRAHIEAMRSHVETLGMWTAAVRLTQ
jgi:hypothetical protein